MSRRERKNELAAIGRECAHDELAAIRRGEDEFSIRHLLQALPADAAGVTSRIAGDAYMEAWMAGIHAAREAGKRVRAAERARDLLAEVAPLRMSRGTMTVDLVVDDEGMVMSRPGLPQAELAAAFSAAPTEWKEAVRAARAFVIALGKGGGQ